MWLCALELSWYIGRLQIVSIYRIMNISIDIQCYHYVSHSLATPALQFEAGRKIRPNHPSMVMQVHFVCFRACKIWIRRSKPSAKNRSLPSAFLSVWTKYLPNQWMLLWDRYPKGILQDSLLKDPLCSQIELIAGETVMTSQWFEENSQKTKPQV